MGPFEELQAGLGRVLALNRPGSGVEHVMVMLPSFGVGETVLAHYADRLPALEHRYLVAQFALCRIDTCHMVFLCSVPPAPDILSYYARLAPPERREALRERFRVLTVDDPSHRSMAAKLLDRPAILDGLRASFAGRPAFVEPWNVTDDEVAVALRLGAPVNGATPALWPLGFKSAGRRLFAEAGVPAPAGREDVRSVDDVVAAAAAIRAERPRAGAVVVKHDNSVAGDGNAVIDLGGVPAGPAADAEVRARVEALPEWYLRDLAAGGIVEERIEGAQFASPSAQIDLLPGGEVVVLSTHEQVLGGPHAQVYVGCRFPADPAYAAALAHHARAVGERLAARGVVGRAGIDFAAAGDPGGRWSLYALEVNLRKGGTTHPFSALRNLVPGRYDPDAGAWRALDGSTRAYCATDNLVDPAWTSLPPASVIGAVAGAGLEFDPATGVGVVLHMLSCLPVDGRCGVVAIGRTPAEAAALEAATREAVAAAASRVLA